MESTQTPSQTASLDISLALPKLTFQSLSVPSSSTRGEVEQWTMVFAEDMAKLFTPGLSTRTQQTLTMAIWGGLGQDYRVQLELETVSLLCGVFYQDKILRLLGPKAGRELFLLTHLEQSHEILKELEEHTKRVVSLSPSQFPSVIQQVTEKNQLTEFLSHHRYEDADELAKQLMHELMTHIKAYRPSLFERLSDFGLNLTANFGLIRVHLLKFLAILPALDHDLKGREVKRIFLETFRRLCADSEKASRQGKKGQERPLPGLYAWSFKTLLIIGRFLPANILSRLIRKTVRLMAKRFIAGETIEKAAGSMKSLQATHRDATLDQLGELVVSETEADHYLSEVLKLIRGFSLHVKTGELNAAGINRAHVSIKISALGSDFNPQAFEHTYALVGPRLREILIVAKEHSVFINIDAEHYHYRDLAFKIFRRVLLETPELSDFKSTGIVLQAYLRDASLHLLEIVKLAEEREICMPLRLVKGAYWDAETIEADVHGFDAPEFLNKEETDLHFRQLICEIFKQHPHVQLCLASHNISDHCYAEALREKYFSDLPAIEHQCLHMTYEALSYGLSRMQWPTRNYVPVGSLLVGMAYLVRRIMENSSQVGVLTIMRSHKKMKKLASPKKVHLKNIQSGRLEIDKSVGQLSASFYNITPVRTYRDCEEQQWRRVLKNYQSKKFHNQFLQDGTLVEQYSPSNPDFKVGEIYFGRPEDAARALERSQQSFEKSGWAQGSEVLRSGIFLRAADLYLVHRLELAALIVHEAGKSSHEALADVDEAIDFLNYYAREQMRFKKEMPELQARGVCAVIAPWNFPLAIPIGMASAALVCGNTVILKSAEQTPLIAQAGVDLLHRAGVPQDVLIHLPGEGEEVGSVLVEDSRLSGLVFTGSKKVGQWMYHKAAKRIAPNQRLTKVITEMGGKNAIIVTANAELDETVSGILYSAFAHAGQKCSAASRIIVHHSVKERLIERLREACRDIYVGEASDEATQINPIITSQDQARLRAVVKEASAEAEQYAGQTIIDRSCEDLAGYAVGPSLFEIDYQRALSPGSYAQREHFGPVVHIIGFHTLEEAIELFNATEYALTGGIFSQSQDDIDQLLARLEAGNLYVNRACTGARVAIEPFGGFKLSGTGPKAGSSSYLQAFLQKPYAKLDEKNELIEEGSDYQFDLALNSKLTLEGRIKRLDGLLIALLHNYSSLFQGVYERDKEVIRRFRQWILTDLEKQIIEPHHNRKIPGQLSYNDWSLIQAPLCVVAQTCYPGVECLLYVLSALAVGRGVTLLARNQKTFDIWTDFHDLCLKTGFSRQNFEIGFPSKRLFKTFVTHPQVAGLLCDSGPKQWEEIACLALDELYREANLKKILTKTEAPPTYRFDLYVEQMVIVRSFAINTMRHGAPLDLEL